MKTALKVLGGIVTLLVILIVALPFFIDVDKHRPQIVKAVNEKIHGTLDIGKIELKLWGRIFLKIDGVSLTDAKGDKILSVKDAGVNVPVFSLLTGKPSLRLILNQPEIKVLKSKDGKLNVLKLMKEPASGEGAAVSSTDGDNSTVPQTQDETSVPPIVLASRITVLIEHAHVDYRDEMTGAKYDVKDLSFHVKDVSPTSKIPFDVTAQLDLLMPGNLLVKGPLKFEGNLQATGNPKPFDKIEGGFAVLLNDLDIQMPGTLSKKPGVILKSEMNLVITPNIMEFSNLKFQLADVTVGGKVTTKTENEKMLVDGQIQTNEINLEKLSGLSPIIEKNGLNGKIALDAKFFGPTESLQYNANLKFNGVNLKNTSLAETLSLNGSLNMETNSVKSFAVKMKSPSFDGDLTGALSDFSKPKFKLSFSSKGMDLDKFLAKTKPAASAEETPAKAAQGGSSKAGAPAGEDLNRSLDPLRTNPMVARASGTFDFNIQNLKSNGVVLSHVKGQVALNDLLMELRGLQFEVFDGSLKIHASINMKGLKPQVAVKTEIAGLKTEKMVESQMSFAKNTVSGIFSTKVDMGGTGLNRNEINSNWKGAGSFKLDNAKFSSLEIGKQIKNGLIEKLPPLLRNKIKISDRLADWKGEYSVLEGKFGLKDGVLTLNDLTGKAVPEKGLDLKASGTLAVTDYKMDMNADFIDKYKMLGQEFPKDSRYGTGAISAKIGGSMSNPNFDWEYTLQQLAKNALKDTVKEKGTEAVKKQLDKIQLPDAAKGLLKKFF